MERVCVSGRGGGGPNQAGRGREGGGERELTIMEPMAPPALLKSHSESSTMYSGYSFFRRLETLETMPCDAVRSFVRNRKGRKQEMNASQAPRASRGPAIVHASGRTVVGNRARTSGSFPGFALRACFTILCMASGVNTYWDSWPIPKNAAARTTAEATIKPFILISRCLPLPLGLQ